MKDLNKIRIRDNALKTGKTVEVIKYVQAIIRNKELSNIVNKRSFIEANKELSSAHAGIDVIECSDKVVYQVLKTKSEKYIADRKQFILLKKECAELPSLTEIENLCTTDKAHLFLIAHDFWTSVVFDDKFLKSGNIQIPFVEWNEKFERDSKYIAQIKNILASIFYRMLGNEGELFHAIKVRKSCFSNVDIMNFMIHAEKEKNKNTPYKAFTEFCSELLYNKKIKYETILKPPKHQTIEIRIHDFIVKGNVFQCMYHSHIISDITGIVHIKTDDGIDETVQIPAGFCAECKIFFILTSTYQQLLNKGIILCKVMDKKSYLSQNQLYGSNLAQESILMQYGYNVSQIDNIPDKKRQAILTFLIDNAILSKNEIISYLNFFINQRNSIKTMEQAIQKWQKDRAFVEKYHNEYYKKIEVKSIHKKS